MRGLSLENIVGLHENVRVYARKQTKKISRLLVQLAQVLVAQRLNTGTS